MWKLKIYKLNINHDVNIKFVFCVRVCIGVARYICWSKVAGMGVCTRPFIDSIVNVREGMKSYNIIDTVNNREQPLHRDLRYKTKSG